ncbi:tetratricopeptide repeat protein [Cyanobium sp. Alchichica 3B3-8F6]|uniref:tetratricopeptide repeat protein n=1 Tax=Synechococcales TaxID=1890424 RepID=UPI000B989EDC|nr:MULTISPECIES: tetratricopeptide repeat protein [Synechococcales]MCP9881545.1 tetratricopeptide repeat protein [Cyanobium sp. Alchichica 3B3-8F6]MCP9942717.1 tetratricopeptide repeat protein [Cyanobium sp. ATX 6E8]
MDALLPQAYLIGLIVLLGVAAVVVARQIWRVRADEVTLAKLEQKDAAKPSDAATLYELGSVQLRKRLYGQAAESLKQALKKAEASKEPPEAQAVIQNALGFALAAQNNYKGALRHYRLALEAKPAYPVALNNLAYALEKQLKLEEARATYEQVIALDASNKTARKRLKLLERKAGLNQAA